MANQTIPRAHWDEEGEDDVLEIESATGTLRLRLRFPSTDVMDETE